MSTPDQYRGYPVKGSCDPAIVGSDRYNQLTWAARQWRKAALESGQCQGTCVNAAVELEIERDKGLIVHLNRRTG